ncbi:hypothetical protein CspeluHIS016_0114470 [Cutaneotrichosporon spelunceum]|uniref:HSF-type DNA-binding domain-containing protein n=1 Tax=Cutaneotrichosporon spelunceum TaxID=1672016 RepID=A0AAD3Y9G0_9TREE|nr:hypothetical protein CspeluHIS016_0114470 [Cutaneotrichosporon spelunceum]
MEAFPANSLEDPFLEPDHDPAIRDHRGSSPHLAIYDLHLDMPGFGTPSGLSGAGDQPSPDTSCDRPQNFGDAHAADTLVTLANWSSQPHFVSYSGLQTTICPEAVRPRTAEEHDYSVLDTPPSYASVFDYSSSSSFTMPTPTRLDVPIHPEAFEAEPKYNVSQPNSEFGEQCDVWSLPASQVSPMSDLPSSSVPRLRQTSLTIDPNLSPPIRQAPSPSFSSTSSTAWTDMLKSPSIRRFSTQMVPAPLKFSARAVTEDLPSPTMSIPGLAHNTEICVQRYDNEGIFELDSPSQVYQQLTDPLELSEPTEVDSDDDGEYMDNAEEEDGKRPTQVRVPQKQNHRKTFKVGLWDAINDPSFRQWIRWSEDGKHGEIPDKTKFQGSKAMRAITDAKDFGGFVRQLHMWGFTRFSFGAEKSCGFRHDNFRRGRFELLEQMKRKGETKVIRQATKPKPRPKRSTRAKNEKTTAAADSSAIKPKITEPARKPKGSVKHIYGSKSKEQGPTDDLNIVSNPAATNTRTTRRSYATSSVSPSPKIHKQSAERDSPIVAAPKHNRASKRGAPYSNGTLNNPAALPTLGSSANTILKGPMKRRAPTPDPIPSPFKSAKVARSRHKGMRM